MKTMLVYSSKTDNTRKVADAINQKLNADFYDRVENVDYSIIDDYDLIVVGGWIDKGTMNKEVVEFMSNVKDKNVGFFFTLGAYPSSMHAFDCIDTIKGEFEKNNNNVVAYYHCQGAIDPKLISWMKTLSKDHPHSPDEDRLNRWSDASKHPNSEDFNAAKNFVSTLLRKVGELNVSNSI